MFVKCFSGQACLVLMAAVCASPNRAPAQVSPSTSAPAVQPGAQPASAQPGAPEDAGIGTKSPGDLYKEARHPLEVVRRSLDNWSDAELGALAVGMHKAGEDCAEAKPEDYKGDDLFDLARLCSFGQNWNGANTAAIGSPTKRTTSFARIGCSIG